MSAQPPSISDVIGPPRGGLPRWLMPALFGGFLLAGILAVLVLANRTGGSDAPPQPPAFATPAPSRIITAFDVREVAGDVLTLASAGSTADRPATVTVRSDAAIEILTPARAADIEPGDWLTVIGVPNEVRNYSITAMVVIPPPHGPAIDQFRTTAGGFIGHEAIRDAEQVPILGGEVIAVDLAAATAGPGDDEGTADGEAPAVVSDTVTLTGPDGPIVVTLTPAAPLLRIRAGTAADIAEGDRIAVPGTSAADATVVLVLPGGAATAAPEDEAGSPAGDATGPAE